MILPRAPISPNPSVTILVPVRNEERFIEQFLNGLCGQDFPRDRMEVIILDGQSSDRTVALAETFHDRLPSLLIRSNPARQKAPALNVGLTLATGEVVLVMDCHTRYRPNYVSGLMDHLRTTGADYVGGRVDTEPGADTFVAKAIALALAHPFGVGGGTYRTSTGDGEGLAPFGCYRRTLPFAVGGYNERLPRTHDDEFIARIMRHGGICLICGDICSTYFTRPTLGGLLEQMFGNGSNHIATFLELPGHLFARHYVPFAFVTALVLGLVWCLINSTHWMLLALVLGPYVLLDLVSSQRLARKTRWTFFPVLLGLFPLIHVVYGLGTWWGVFAYGLFRRHRRQGRKTGQELIGLAGATAPSSAGSS